MLIDARQVIDGAEFRYDLVIIGAGPAGISLVEELRGSGISIGLLEGGGLRHSVQPQQLYRGEIVGQSTWPLHTSRFRVFGGSGNRWGGMSRPLEASDYERRDWVPDSGWPISAADLDGYRQRTVRLLELPRDDFDAEAWADLVPAGLPIQGSDFANAMFQFSPLETRFGDNFRDRILTAPDVTTFVHANLTDLRLDPGTDRIGPLTVQSLAGRRFTVRGQAVVLAAGGLENARLLLAARTDRPAGLGNEHDLVGRYFMDHLHVPAGHIAATVDGADRAFYQVGRYAGARVRGMLMPTAAAQQEHRLLAASIGLEPPVFPNGQPLLNTSPRLTVGPEWLYHRLRRGTAVSQRAGAGYKQSVRALWQAARSAELRRAARLARRSATQAGLDPVALHALYFRSEQAPNPDSRMTLSQRRDPLGVPEISLDWRLTAQDTDSITGWLDVLDRTLAQRGLGRVITPADGWQRAIIGGPHHMGTTRMAPSPRRGVVDADCRVHSVANLFVAGSSVFATGGFANPTFTLLALTIRLADQLRAQLRSPLGLGREAPPQAATG